MAARSDKDSCGRSGIEKKVVAEAREFSEDVQEPGSKQSKERDKDVIRQKGATGQAGRSQKEKNIAQRTSVF